MDNIGTLLESGAEGLQRKFFEAGKRYSRAIDEHDDVNELYGLDHLDSCSEGVKCDVMGAVKMFG